MDNLINSMSKATGKTADDLRTEAEEALQDDLASELVQSIIDIVESNVTIEYDENEDGKFTWVDIDTPNNKEQLKEAILEYRIEKK